MKYILISISIIACILLSSCGNGWLDDAEPRTGTSTEEAIKRLEDAQYALNGLYYTLRQYEYYGARFTYYGDVTADDMQAYSSSKRCGKYYLFTLNNETTPSNFWDMPYKLIRNIHDVLNSIGNIDQTNFTDAQKAQVRDVRGQALAMRAMAHFDLVKLHGNPYTKDNGASLGVPIITAKYDYDYFPKRNTVAEVYNQVILKDLEESLNYLGTDKKSGKLNKYGAWLLLARAYLYMNNNDKAYEEATKLITEAESKGYKLWSRDEYPTIWSKENTSELFLELVVKAEEGSSSKEMIGYLMWESGYKDIILTSSFVSFIDKDQEDIRRTVITKVGSRNYLLKYPGNDGENPTYANIPVLRLSEAYLIAAEAAVKESDNPNALKYLNAIVERANPTKTVTGSVTLDRVLDERRKELVGEGHRFFDIMRNDKRVERTGSSHLSALKDEAKSFDRDYFKTLLAIPKGEMDANPNMKQNPGY